MITSIEIENYRGIKKGVLSNLPRIAVLTGPNGCGKSSVLEAIEIGSTPERRLEDVAQRWGEHRAGRAWFTYRGELAVASLRVRWDKDGMLVKTLSGNAQGMSETVETRNSALNPTRFLEHRPGFPRPPLLKLLTEAKTRGATGAAVAIIREVDPTVNNLEILVPADHPVVHFIHDDRAVPVGLAGDGMESIVRLALELGQQKDGTFLIEEPETHQHTRALLRTARILVAAARNGAQIVLSTHSMELLDDMLADLKDEELDWLAVYRLRLIEGDLRVLRMSGTEANEARTEIEDDLR